MALEDWGVSAPQQDVESRTLKNGFGSLLIDACNQLLVAGFEEGVDQNYSVRTIRDAMIVAAARFAVFAYSRLNGNQKDWDEAKAEIMQQFDKEVEGQCMFYYGKE